MIVSAALAFALAGWTTPDERLLRLVQDADAVRAADAPDVDRPANRDMEIGRWYLGWHDYTSALNRFKVVTTRFQTSSQVEEALARLVEAYLALGLRSEAERTSAELSQRFPDGQWSASARAALQSAPHDPANGTR